MRAGQGFVETQEGQGGKLLRLATTVQWLVLDDLGVECTSEKVIQWLYIIIEKRRAGGLVTIFTSNRDAEDLAAYWRPAGRSAATFQDGLRIIDRLGEYCFVVAMHGRNQRER